MTSVLDLSKKRHAHIDRRLRENAIVWLTSVRPDGRPHAVAVWFLWDGETILIFSQPDTQKVRNLRQNPHVLLAVDNTHDGADPITIEGTATLLEAGITDATRDSYLAKYGEGIKQLGYTLAQMVATYSQAIRVVPTHVS